MRKYVTIVAVAGMMLACASGAQAAYTGGWYYTDFEDGGDPLTEWSDNRRETTPGTAQHPADTFLGQFGLNQEVRLNLSGLPSHDRVTVYLDLYIINTWDGDGEGGGQPPSEWSLSVEDGPTLVDTTFSNTTYNQDYPEWRPNGDYPPTTGADEIDSLGYPEWSPDYAAADCMYNFPDADDSFTTTFDHSADTLVLIFRSVLNESVANEGWGLDNIQVVPEPTTLLPLALGGLALLPRRQ